MAAPLTIRMHADDNVAIVANDGGLAAGTVLPEGVPFQDAAKDALRAEPNKRTTHQQQ